MRKILISKSFNNDFVKMFKKDFHIVFFEESINLHQFKEISDGIDFVIVTNYFKHLMDIKSINSNIQIFIYSHLNEDDSYDLLINSKASLIIANNIFKFLVITKEKSIIPFKALKKLYKFIKLAIDEKYYRTKIVNEDTDFSMEKAIILNLLNTIKEQFYFTGKYMFGTIAVRLKNSNQFITSVRGKEDFSDFCLVTNVDNNKLIVESTKKATLNAPLLFNIFKNNPSVNIIVHTHNINKEYKTLNYAFPGSITDSNREIYEDFNIEYHGSFGLINEK